MSIGLNYTHERVGNALLLPNYAYFLQKYHPLVPGKLFSHDIQEMASFSQYITDGTLYRLLDSADAEQYFEAPHIRDILLEAYPYEIELKYLGKDVVNDIDRNERLVLLFDTFFDVDYHATLKTYCETCDRGEAYTTFLHTREWLYTDRDTAVQAYLTFFDALLRSQGYADEANRLEDFAQHNLYIKYTEGISGVTTERNGTVYIEVGNNTYTTLFHELTHFINRFFRYHYYEDAEVCFDHFTKTNEGLSNFIAYHLHQEILGKDISRIEHMATDPLYFSFYIDIYATLLAEGTHKKEHNIDLITHELQRFEGELLTPEKTDFYIQRFYKFFHYDQHTYFYPKEMMYYLGYHGIREIFAASTNKTQLLTQCLLGKVCL